MIRLPIRAVLWALLALLLPAAARATTVEVTSVAAEGAQFRLTLSDGRVLRSPDLARATLTVATRPGSVGSGWKWWSATPGHHRTTSGCTP